jgi:arginase
MNELMLIGVNSVLGIQRPNLQCDLAPLFNYINSERLFTHIPHLKSYVFAPKLSEQTVLDHQTLGHKKLLNSISVKTQTAIDRHVPFIVVSGDHSTAMGTWGGVMNATCNQRLGLIWLDAHMDAHDFDTTPSGNLHGMPVAALLGIGDKHLTNFAGLTKVIQPTDLVLIGVRSYEVAERLKLETLGVTIIYQQEVATPERFAASLKRVHTKLAATCSHVGMSIDLDVLSPEQVVAVATPEENGTPISHLLFAIKQLPSRAFDGIEIAEYYSSLDPDLQTQKVITTLLKHLLVKLKY